MAHCCDGCVYERPGGECAREDTYIKEHEKDHVVSNNVVFAIAILSICAMVIVAIIFA